MMVCLNVYLGLGYFGQVLVARLCTDLQDGAQSKRKNSYT